MSEMAAGDPAPESTIHRHIWPDSDEEPQFFDTYEYLIYTPRFEDPRASSAKVDSIRRKLEGEATTRGTEDKNNTMLCGKMIRVTKANRDPDVRKSGIGNVFVKNLNESMDNIQLKKLFQNFGNILSCKVLTFEDGKSKGYGFVHFDTEESSNAAIENLNGT
ncbi:polyadenylate-binding protein 7, partial [Tanacetum coccineum]